MGRVEIGNFLAVSHRLSTRSRASIISDFTRENAKLLLGSMDGVEPNEDLGFFKIYVNGMAVLRFKRIGSDGIARNLRTDQQIDYYNDVPIRGLHRGTRMTAGYLLNATETEIADIRITRQFGRDRLLWWFSILNEADGGADVRGFTASPAPAPEVSQVRIRPIVEKRKEA